MHHFNMWKELTSCWKRYETRNRKKKSKGFYSVIRDWWLHSSSLKTDIIHNCKIFLEKNSLIIHFTFCSICLKSRNISAILPKIRMDVDMFHVLVILLQCIFWILDRTQNCPKFVGFTWASKKASEGFKSRPKLSHVCWIYMSVEKG